MRKRSAGRGGAAVVSLQVCREAAALSGLSMRETEISALRGGMCPSRYERTIGTFGLEGQAKLLESLSLIHIYGGMEI